EVHLETQGHEEDRREDRRERSGGFREVLLEGRVREHTSREECADDRGQSERLRREGEEERNRHRDEEAAERDPQRGSFDVNSCNKPAKDVDANRHPDEEKSDGFCDEDHEINEAYT